MKLGTHCLLVAVAAVGCTTSQTNHVASAPAVGGPAASAPPASAPIPASPPPLMFRLAGCSSAQAPAPAYDGLLVATRTGSGAGVGRGLGGMRGWDGWGRVPTVSIGQPNLNGAIDKAIVRRYIKRNIQKIQYCYEKALIGKPALHGTVSTQFYIAPDGKVTRSEASGVDPDVASCVAGVIGAIEFPKPTDGNGAQVNYPFTFHHPDGDIESADAPQAPRGPVPWTPFGDELAPASPELVTATSKAVTARLAQLGACIPAQTAAAVRAIIEVSPDGTTRASVGGAGDASIESCASQALAGLTVAVPAAAAEVSCDLVRGDAPPWRVTVGPAYSIIEAGSASYRAGAIERHYGDPDVGSLRPAHDGELHLIIAEPDLDMAKLDVVLDTIRHQPVVVAVRDASGLAPRFAFALGRADPAWAHHEALALLVAGHQVGVCSAQKPPAAVTDPHALDEAIAAAPAACRGYCDHAELHADATTTAAELLAITSSLHAVAIDRVRVMPEPCSAQ